MKQTFYAIGMLTLIVCGQASAQTSETSFITKSSIMNSPFASGKAAVAAARVSVNALDRFRKDYRDARDVEWVEVANGYRAYFLLDAVLTAVDYTKKGKLYSVIRYGKNLLIPALKGKLDEKFAGCEIREVTEVKIADFSTKAFVVVLEDKVSLKTVQIIEDDISVISEMEK